MFTICAIFRNTEMLLNHTQRHWTIPLIRVLVKNILITFV